MKQVIVGVFDCGLDQIQLVLREGTGGEFYFVPGPGELPRVKVGADSGGGKWHAVVGVLIHEIFEMQMTRSHCRWELAPDYGRDHSGYSFVMSHTMFSDIAVRVAEYMTAALPDLCAAWKRWGKPPRKLSRKRKPKSK